MFKLNITYLHSSIRFNLRISSHVVLQGKCLQVHVHLVLCLLRVSIPPIMMSGTFFFLNRPCSIIVQL